MKAGEARVRWRRALLVCFLVAGGATASPAAAQEPVDTTRTEALGPDSLAVDSLLTARDSADARVRGRLQALARPPGTPPDTLPDPSGAGRAGAQARATGVAGGDSISAGLLGLDGYRVTQYDAVAATYRATEEALILYGSRGAPDVGPPRDTLSTEEADSVMSVVSSLRDAADSLAFGLADTTAIPADTAEARELRVRTVARMDSLFSLADSLHRLARPDEMAETVVRANLASTDGYRLSAEGMIRFNQRTDKAEARGDPTFTPADGGDPVQADSLNIDVGGQRASAFEAKTRYDQGGGTNWNVTGDLPSVGQSVVYGDHTRFTSCDLEEPHYHFEADNLKIVQGSVLVARPVRLYFGDVPVAWLPFVAQSLSRGRASGLLTPRFSVNDIVRTSGGYRRRLSNVGFYWAMSDYSDATVAVDWFDDTFTSLTGALRFRWLRQFLTGGVNFRQYWRQNGSTEQSLDSRVNWELSERTRFQSAIRFASSTDFVRRNSFDPREVTQQISSSGGLSRRFDWGTINVSGNRRQSLSSDEVNMTLPDVSLSMNTLNLFQAPPARASWYNNISLGGSAKFSRAIVDRAPDTLGFRFSNADLATSRFSGSTSLTVGNFSVGQSLSYTEDVTRDVPVDSLVFFPDQLAQQGMRAFDSRLGQAFLAAEEGETGRQVDVSKAEINWTTSLDYQQTLIGSTTLTPRLSFSGQARQADTIDVAQSFVSGPTRVSFGAALKADIYGFYGGVGNFEAIRHKLTPSFSYDWSPEVQPTELQERVFSSRAARPRSVLSVGLNQTWEAKRKAEEPEDSASAPDSIGDPSGSGRPPPEGPGEAGAEPDPSSTGVAQAEAPPSTPSGLEDEGPRRLERAEIVNLLSIQTSAVSYDFVEADSVGRFLAGFQTTTLNNTISSDFLRGLTISMTHDLFDDVLEEGGEGEPGTPRRKFDPHLQSMNFGFDLSPRSSILGLLGLAGGAGGDDADDEDEEEPTEEDEDLDPDAPYFGRSATDETAILPGSGTDQDVREGRSPARSRGGGDWSARFSYALNRPREGGNRVSQILQIGLRLNPTPLWEMSWNTAYDLEESTFNDHRIRLTRDLHRWQAHFDFLKTATGNWSFRFEVSLLDNQDLKFDYEQRDLEAVGRR
jgi:hypothetical protein